ncbi:MAG: ABC transporter ATP-binding protein [Brevundimonas sp.]|nr:ABC transporter ATP-binding protein [Brevundimonas sp.]
MPDGATAFGGRMIIAEELGKSYPMGSGRKVVFNNLNFTIGRHDKVGLLGRNGAGKTTLIKLIGQVEMPSTGRVTRHMSVSWPLGFSGGFHGSLTGYDNARFIARIYDRDYRDMRDFVEDFTELGVQLKMPVKTYSSGMRARLAFALSLAIEFDCYMIDEIILVGDQNFHRKCHYELFEKRADRAMLLASHSPDIIREFCNRAMVLHKGSGSIYDDVNEALNIYDQL